MAAGVGQLTQVGIEVFFALGAAVLGIADPQVNGTVGGQVSEIMQFSREDFVAIRSPSAMGARLLLVGEGPPFDFRLG
jgi:hypothetical protein